MSSTDLEDKILEFRTELLKDEKTETINYLFFYLMRIHT